MKIHKAFNILLIVVLLLTGFTASATSAKDAGGASIDQMKTFSILAGLGAESLGISEIEGNLGIAAEGVEAVGDWLVGGERHFGPGSLAGNALEEARSLSAELAQKDCDITVDSHENAQPTVFLSAGVTCFEGETVTLNEITFEHPEEEATIVIRVDGDLVLSEGSLSSLAEPTAAGSIYWAIGGSLTAGERSELTGTFLVKGNIELGARTRVSGRLISLEGSIMLNEGLVRFDPAEQQSAEPVGPIEVVEPEPTIEPTPAPTPEPIVEPTPEPTVEPYVELPFTPNLAEQLDSDVVNPTAGEKIPTPLQPNGNIYLKYPTFTWTLVAGASNYNIQVFVSGGMVINKIVPASACGPTQCSAVLGPLPYISLYFWRASAYTGSWQPWSSFKYFTRLNPIPTLIAPSGTISISNPQFQWKPIPGATYYNIELYISGRLYTYMTLTKNACSSTICQVRLSNNLPANNYFWRVKVYIEGSWNAFSNFMYFTVIQPYPILIAPSGLIAVKDPQFQWKPSAGATNYFIELYNSQGLYTYMTLTSNACSSIICQVKLSNSLPEGSFYWRVKAYGGMAWGPFSPFMYFQVPALWGNEIEPNDVTPQYLDRIGLDYYVRAGIQKLGDVDKFSFDAVSGRTYTIELFNLDKVLGTPGTNCYYYNRSGLAIQLFNASGSEVVKECQAWGPGDVRHVIEHTATMTGKYVIQIWPNSGSVTGNYYLRILPKFDEPGAKWDPVTMEPNNNGTNAFLLNVGLNQGLRSEIQWRDPDYYTSFVDEDWFRFYAVAGRTYTIELYNVANILAGGDGVYLTVWDPNWNQIAHEYGNGSANVFSFTSRTATQSGWYYLRVLPDSDSVAGSYNLRVLPKYNEPGAAWDSSFESNNYWANAYPISVGTSNALSTSIMQRDPAYLTATGDYDNFYFPAVQGGTYLIELINVDDSLDDYKYRYPCGWGEGMFIIVADPNLNQVAADCEAEINDPVHNSVSFTASATGTYYFWVATHSESVNGNYTVRVTRTN